MIEINGICNTKSDQALKSKRLEMAKNGKAKSILLTRNESEKSRMRKVSDKGTEVAPTIASRIVP